MTCLLGIFTIAVFCFDGFLTNGADHIQVLTNSRKTPINAPATDHLLLQTSLKKASTIRSSLTPPRSLRNPSELEYKILKSLYPVAPVKTFLAQKERKVSVVNQSKDQKPSTSTIPTPETEHTLKVSIHPRTSTSTIPTPETEQTLDISRSTRVDVSKIHPSKPHTTIPRDKMSSTVLVDDVKWNFSEPICKQALCELDNHNLNTLISHCFCDQDCLNFGDCCVNFESFNTTKYREGELHFDINNDTLGDPIGLDDSSANDESPFSDYYRTVEKRNAVKTKCRKYKNMDEVQVGIPNSPRYLKIVAECPTESVREHPDEDDVTLCERSGPSEHWSGLHVTAARRKGVQVDKYSPRTRSTANFFFKNIHCARCNGMNDKDLELAPLNIKCGNLTQIAYDKWRFKGMKAFQDYILVHCKYAVEFERMHLFTSLGNRHKCIPFDMVRNVGKINPINQECPLRKNNIFLDRKRLFHLCHNYRDEFNHGIIRYTNRHCFLCYTDNTIVDVSYCYGRSPPSPGPMSRYPSFRLLLDPRSGAKLYNQDSPVCRAVDERTHSCIDGGCPAAQMKVFDGNAKTCKPVYMKPVDQLLKKRIYPQYFIYLQLVSPEVCDPRQLDLNLKLLFLQGVDKTTFRNGTFFNSTCHNITRNSGNRTISTIEQFYLDISPEGSFSEYVFCLRFEIDAADFINFMTYKDRKRAYLFSNLMHLIENQCIVCPPNIVEYIVISTVKDADELKLCKSPLRTKIRRNITLNGYNVHITGTNRNEHYSPISIYDRDTSQSYKIADVPFAFTLLKEHDILMNFNIGNYEMRALVCEPDILSCKTLTLNSREYANTSNGVLIYGNHISEEHLTRSINGTILICDYRFKYTHEHHSNIEGIITLVGMIISICSLFATIVTYGFLSKLRRNSPSVAGIIGFSCSLMLAQILFLISGYPNGSLCVSVSVGQHFCWLSSFCWSNVLAYRVHRSITSLVLPSFNKWSIYVFALLVPFIFVFVLLLLHLSNSGIFYYGNSNGTSICFIEHVGINNTIYSLQKLLTFNLPIAISLVSNIFLFSRTIYYLQTSFNRTNPGGIEQYRSKFKIYTKLTSLMGFSWISGELAIVPGLSFLWIPFVLFNSLQGLYVFASFGLRGIFTVLKGADDVITSSRPALRHGDTSGQLTTSCSEVDLGPGAAYRI